MGDGPLTPEEILMRQAEMDLEAGGIVMLPGQGALTKVHDASECHGRHCWVHDPSAHPLRHAPIVWRADKHAAERRCVHGIGHPDPDDLAYQRMVGRSDMDWLENHNCDGCCSSSVKPSDR